MAGQLLGAQAAQAEQQPVKVPTNWKVPTAILLLLLLCSWGCTQYVAHYFAYQEGLGKPWAVFGQPGEQWSLYAPWNVYGWYLKYALRMADPAVRYPFDQVSWALYACGGVLFLWLLHLTYLKGHTSRAPKKSTLHGSAEFADLDVIEKSGLLKGTFPTAPTELGTISAQLRGQLPTKSSRDELKLREGVLQAASKADGEALVQMVKAGKDYLAEDLKFLKDSRWLAKQKRRMTAMLGTGQAAVVGGTRLADGSLVPLLDAGGRHILLYAPSGSGKGVAAMLPTLFTYQQSVIVHDVKKENYVLTAGMRKTILGQKVLLVEPLDDTGASAKFNPLLSVRVGTLKEVTDIDAIGMIMTGAGSSTKGKSDPFFDNSARDLFRGAALHVLYAQDKNPNMGDVLSLLSSKPMDELCEELADFDHARGRTLYWTTDERTGERISTHPNVRESFMRILAAGDKTMGSIKATLESTLNFYADPVVRMNTSTSDFTIDDIVNGDVPVSLYLVAPPTETDKVGPFFSILINLILKRLTNDLTFVAGQQRRSSKHELLFLLDEFPALATLEAVPKALGFVRAYGLRFYLVCQDPAQLKQRYGEEGMGTIFANCHVRAAMTPNDLATAKTLTEYLGKATVIQENESVSTEKGKGVKSSSISVQYHGRDLLNPAELMQLPEHQLIVLTAGNKPILGEKCKYFEDEVWSKWARFPPPKCTDRIRQVTTAFASSTPAAAPAAAPKPKTTIKSLDDIPIIDDEDLDPPELLDAGPRTAALSDILSGKVTIADLYPPAPGDADDSDRGREFAPILTDGASTLDEGTSAMDYDDAVILGDEPDFEPVHLAATLPAEAGRDASRPGRVSDDDISSLF